MYIYMKVCRQWVEITLYLQNGNSDVFHTEFKFSQTCVVICSKFANQFRLVSSFSGGQKIQTMFKLSSNIFQLRCEWGAINSAIIWGRTEALATQFSTNKVWPKLSHAQKNTASAYIPFGIYNFSFHTFHRREQESES